MVRRLSLAAFLLASLSAHAVIIRGHVTTPLGAPLPGARVQLILLSGGPRNASASVAGLDGDFEIRTDLAGQFLLLTAPSITAPFFAPQVGAPFYAGRTDLLNVEIALNPSLVTPLLSAQPTLLETPPAQLSTPPAQIAADQLLPRATPIPELASTPSAFIVQRGQLASPATLYLRGAPVARILIDGVSAESLASRPAFNLSTLTSTGLSALSSLPALELTPTPNPLHFLDAQSGTLSLTSPRAADLHPTLTYTGDAGNLDTYRNEAVFTLVRSRADALVAFSRLNSSNDLPAAPIHLITYAANLGYHISAGTTLRLTFRDDTTAAPLPTPFDFFRLLPSGRQSSQNLYSTFTFETRTAGNWHNLVRYGLLRERGQLFNFATPATGPPVIITGANGFTASGTATFPLTPPREDLVTNRDEISWQSDYPLTHFLTGLLTARFQQERAADITATRRTLDRTHFSVAAALQGELRHRLFYTAAGFIDTSSQLGLRGTPRAGLTWVPVRPGARRFRGTSLHATAATGIREPTLSEQLSTSTPQIPHARALDFGADQDILPHKLSVRGTYFFNQFSHQAEPLALIPLTLSDTLAYRTQGLESSVRYQPFPRLLLTGGYTYLASLVERSVAPPAFNPNLLNTPIGALTALPGSRPFHRPPNSGFFSVAYSGAKTTASLQAALAGRSDDSTFLTLNPTLILPNRNLSPGYTSLNASFAYALSHSITVFTQLSNLLDNRHIAPIGYLSTPFQFRAGLRIRLGRE